MKAARVGNAPVVGLPVPPRRPEWHRRAKCRGDDLGHDRIEHLPRRQRQAEARLWCQGCPVMAECARTALANQDQGVVAGGIYIESKSGNGSRVSTDSHQRLERLAQ